MPRSGLTTNEFAALYGVDVRTVKGWEEKGWIVRTEDRFIDEAASVALVDKKRDRSRSHRHSEPKLGAVNGTPARAKAEDPYLAPIPADVDIDEARRRKEYWQGERARLDVEQTAGRLIDAESAARAWASSSVLIRTAILATAPRLAPEVAGMTDVVAIEAVITRELTAALTALAAEWKK
jgi:hypothetical protein